MKKDSHELLSCSELMYILSGFMIAAGILTLPADIIKTAKQDGWISCILGSAYPILISISAIYLHKKFPNDNILDLSIKYFGKIIGKILNFIFILFFLFLLIEISSALNNVLLIYTTPFLNKYKIILTSLLVPAFISYKGIKTLSSVNGVIFYLTLIAILIPIPALKEGSLFNIMPVFGSGTLNIVKATKETAFAFSGFEAILILYPFIGKNSDIKKASIKSISITALIYSWIAFVTIYYLGIDAIPKFLWPVVTTTEAAIIPVINSFRYIFMSLWILIMFKSISNYYYLINFSLSETIHKFSREKLSIFLYPLFVFLATRVENPTIRRYIVSQTLSKYILFNIIYISSIVLITVFKKGDKHEKKS